MQLHPLSLALGLTAAVGIAASQASFTATPIPTPAPQVLGVVPGSWWKAVRLDAGTSPFVVPAGMHYVVHLIRGNGGGPSNLLIDGEQPNYLAQFFSDTADKNGARVAFPPGTTIMHVTGGDTTLFGYLDPR